MNQYAYTAIDSQGQACEGLFSAENLADAVVMLTQQGFSVQSIVLSPVSTVPSFEDDGVSASSGEIEPGLRARIDTLLETRQLWLPAVAATRDELPPGGPKRELSRVVASLSQGFTPESRLEAEDAALLLRLLASGAQAVKQAEHSGTSDGKQTELNKWIHDLVEVKQERRRKASALTYPLSLFSLSYVVLLAAALFLIPVYRQMYEEFGLSLPEPTLWLLWLCDLVTFQSTGTLVVLVCAGAALFLLVRWWRSKALTNRLLGRFVAGSTSNLRAMSRFAGTLAELLDLDASLGIAFRWAGKASRHKAFALAADQIASDIENHGLHVRDSRASLRLPPTLLFAVEPSEGRPPCAPLLRELSLVYSGLANNRFSWIGASLPAAAMVFAGLFIGFIVIALFVPLVSMVTSLA